MSKNANILSLHMFSIWRKAYAFLIEVSQGTLYKEVPSDEDLYR